MMVSGAGVCFFQSREIVGGMGVLEGRGGRERVRLEKLGDLFNEGKKVYLGRGVRIGGRYGGVGVSGFSPR